MNERFGLSSPTKLGGLLSLAGHRAATGMDVDILALARFGHARHPGDLCFCDRNPAADLELREAGGVVLTTEPLVAEMAVRVPAVQCVVLEEPRRAFIQIASRLLASGGVEVSDAIPRPLGVHPSARIGDHSVIHPEVRIDANVVIGHHCVLHRGVWVQEGATIRDNTVIGSEGMDVLVGSDGNVYRFAHLAGVIIGKRVLVGVGTVIPRGILTSTRIGQDSMIGNLCNVGHGCVLEEDVWVAAGCVIGGHTKVGRKANLGMGATVKDNIAIGAEAQVGMGSVVVGPVNAGASVIGNPARALLGQGKTGPTR